MGDEVIIPPEIGDPCAVCNGLLWPAGKTPRFMEITFEGLVRCPGGHRDPPDGKYYLEQSLGNPCWWNYSDSFFHMSYRPFLPIPTLTVMCVIHPFERYFHSVPGLACDETFANGIVFCGPTTHSKDGFAHMKAWL